MMNEPSPVRAGEEIDEDKLRNCLAIELDRPIDELSVRQFPAGSSNLTYLINIDGREYVLRRPPFGNTIKTAHDMGREFRVLSKLSAAYPLAPKPFLFCDDLSVIGSEFYLMEKRNGIIIRGRAPSELDKSDELRQQVCQSFVSNLADLHRVDYHAAGLGDLGRPEGYNRRQVNGWVKRYGAARTHDLPDLERTIAWLSENVPAESGAALIHNDYKFDNVMLDARDLTRITAVLDWEMVTLGDPLMDLGTTLGYWMSKDSGNEMLSMPFNPRVLMENISRAEIVEMYAVATSCDVSNILFYYVFGAFKIAVIAQQIYSRYVKGSTQDKRFASFDKFVASLGNIATGAISRKTI